MRQRLIFDALTADSGVMSIELEKFSWVRKGGSELSDSQCAHQVASVVASRPHASPEDRHDEDSARELEAFRLGRGDADDGGEDDV